VFAGYGLAFGQSAESPPAEAGHNPFAALLAPSEPQSQSTPTPAAPVAPPEVCLETIVLKFLDAKSLKGVLDKMVSTYGTVAVNEKTNSVIVCDTSENLSRILVEVKKADRTPLQIMVEVVILDVQLKDNAEIGVNWDFLANDRENVTYRQNLTNTRLTAVPPSQENVDNATAYNSVGLGGDFSVITGSLRGVLHAIQDKRDAEILASPRALVVSGQSATIKAVEEIPYQEVIDTAAGGAKAMTATQFKEVGVTLKVKATITDGNNICLDVNTTQNVTAAQSESGIPVVDTREANTQLLLRDSQTVILGGLRRQEKTKQVHQIPILGDLPLIGILFKSVTTVTTHSELVILLSPRIYQEEAVPGEVTARVNAMQSHSPLKTQVTIQSDKAEPRQAQVEGGR
jgi:type IV pilus assembly protein PilQ